MSPTPRFPPDHPVWKIAHTVVQTVCVTAAFAVCLWVTASNFDQTELKALGGGASVVGAVSLALKFIGARQG